METTAQRHLAAIQRGEVTKTNVIGLRKLINASERERAGWSITKAQAKSLEDFDRLDVERTLERCRPRVVGELHASGLALLRSKRYAKRWTEAQRAAIDALDHFTLCGFDRHQPHGSGVYAVPVYQVWAKVPPKGDALDGGSYAAFCFRNIPWQSHGKGPEILPDHIWGV